MVAIAVYPGSFDPITKGHLDIITRASRLFDRLMVGVVKNPNKHPLLTLAQRVELIQTCCESLPNVTVHAFEGLTVDFAAHMEADVIVRGLRAVSDFEFEFKMSQMNKTLNSGVETLFMMASLEHQFLSSSVVKEVARYGGDVSKAVPHCVETLLKEQFQGGLCHWPQGQLPS
ncbi:MAG: pantetheine-phosphate adenylyltransferase [Vampirovibrionales bacterium]